MTDPTRSAADPTVAFRVGFLLGEVGGFALATLPQIYLDSRLHSHVLYHGPRYYLYAPWLLPDVLLMAAISYTVLKSRFHFLALLPFVCSLVAAVPIFRPEVPHMNLVSSGTIWLLIMAAWQWLHSTVAQPSLAGHLANDRDTLRFYVKEELDFCSKVLFGGIAVLFGIVVTATLSLQGANSTTVSAADDRWRLNMYSAFQMAAYSTVYLLGPMREVLGKRNELFRSLRATVAVTDPTWRPE